MGVPVCGFPFWFGAVGLMSGLWISVCFDWLHGLPFDCLVLQFCVLAPRFCARRLGALVRLGVVGAGEGCAPVVLVTFFSPVPATLVLLLVV